MTKITLNVFLAMLAVAMGASMALAGPSRLGAENQTLHSRALEMTYLKQSMAASSMSRPVGAFATSYQLSAGSLFAWQSKSPHNEADTEAVYIITHGVDRNANDYFTYLNNAFQKANSAGLAPTNSLRIAPAFYDASADKSSLDSSTLAWGAGNRWCIGEGSTHPKGSNLSPFTVYDELIEKFSNRLGKSAGVRVPIGSQTSGTDANNCHHPQLSAYPNVKSITLIGHGCGAITTQRYSALRTADEGSIQLRFLVGNPSTMLYFTGDRPSSLNRKSCSVWNDFFFGLDQFYVPYTYSGSPSGTFSKYAQRDVRYLVGLNDNGAGGDQSCAAKAMGGVNRKDRTRAYWKYINLLSGKSADSVSQYPGNFNNLDASSFAGSQLNHQLVEISGVGHSAPGVLNSQEGQQAVFGQ